MRKLRFMIYAIIHMDYKRFFQSIEECHKKSGKSRIWLFFDIIYCGLKYGAGHRDYTVCQWYDLTTEQRKTYVTRAISIRVVQLKNDKDYYHFFENKFEFNKLFSKYIKRKWLYVPECDFNDFTRMMEDLDEVIIKPCDLTSGTGVEKIAKKDFESLEKMYEYITSKGNYMIEEVIKQHPEISRIYPYAINTLRIVSILHDGTSDILYAFIRIGNNMKIVDNINNGGMCAPIDLDTGIITQVGYDKDGNTYEKHPITGTEIKGFRIPYWDEAVRIVKESALVVPQMGYIGWDVAVTPDGPCFVEGNSFPGHDILQLPAHVPDKIGMLPRYKKFIKGL